MIYKDYFINSKFEDVWHTLQTYYCEPEDVKKLYKTLFYTIRNLPIDMEHSDTPLTMESDFEGMIHVSGAPDPIEWLVGREVRFNPEKMLRYSSLGEVETDSPTVPEVTAHLLYWSTLYDFRTQSRYHKDCNKRWDDRMNSTTKYKLPDEAVSLSHKRKQAYYWKETTANDSAIDWSYILKILHKRIEYHIGYHRFTDRFVNSKHYVSRMEMCCRLLELAGADYYNMKDIYVNIKNASRYIGRIFSKYDYYKISIDDNFKELRLTELRRAKAYKILWKFFDHNLTYWWD